MNTPNSGNRKHKVKGVPVQIREQNSGLHFNNSEQLTGGYDGHLNTFACSLQSRLSAHKEARVTDLLSKKL